MPGDCTAQSSTRDARYLRRKEICATGTLHQLRRVQLLEDS